MFRKLVRNGIVPAIRSQLFLALPERVVVKSSAKLLGCRCRRYGYKKEISDAL